MSSKGNTLIYALLIALAVLPIIIIYFLFFHPFVRELIPFPWLKNALDIIEKLIKTKMGSLF